MIASMSGGPRRRDSRIFLAGSGIPSRLILAAFALLAILHPAIADEYRLGALDKVRLTIFEWRPSRAEIFPWTALNAEFTISVEGMLSLPLVGTVRAEALTPEELGVEISEHLQKKLGLVEKPVSAVEVSQYRPFYVTGDVANPGEFAFRPGLTVLKVFALAGGAFRPTGATAAGLERDSTLARGDIRVLRAELTATLAKRSRLKAEGMDLPQVEVPPEFVGSAADPNGMNALREEKLIFESRRNAVRSKIASLAQGKVLLEKEVATLAAKDASLDKQLGLALSERDGIRALAAKGLALGARQLATEQTVAQMETARLDIGIAKVRAEQDQARLDRNILELQDQRRAEILLELRQVEGKIGELRERTITAERLAVQADVTEVFRADEASNLQLESPLFTIARAGGGKPIEIAAEYDTQVKPGDVVQVRRRRANRRPSLSLGRDLSDGSSQVAARLP